MGKILFLIKIDTDCLEVFPLASGLLTHGRSRDFFGAYLTITSPLVNSSSVPVAGITRGANLPTKVVVSLLPAS